MRRVVAKRGDRAVIIRSAPLAEKVRESVNQNFRAGFGGVIEKQVFARLFTSAVLAVVPADKRRLNAGRQHYRTAVTAEFQRIEKFRRKPEIARPEFLGVFRTVHPRQIKDEIGIPYIIV